MDINSTYLRGNVSEMTLFPIQYTACFGPKFNSLYARPRAFIFIVNDIMTQLKLHIGMHVQCH